jgi:hypothetical protein
MAQQECDDVKAMLEEINKSAPRFIELYKDLDSLDNLDEIGVLFLQLKKTLQDNSELRQNLKEWERRSKKIQRIDKIEKKLSEEGYDTDLSIDELYALYRQEEEGNSFSPFNQDSFLYEKTKELRKKRKEAEKEKEDYARIYGCRLEQVTSEYNELFEKNKNIVVFTGSGGHNSKKIAQTLRHVGGNLTLEDEDVKLLKKIKYIGGVLNLNTVTKIPVEGMALPEILYSDLWFGSLESAKGLESLDYTGVQGIVWLPETFSDKDKEKVEEIKKDLSQKGIGVKFEYSSW